jgi:CBS domain containing-hemolysin-like protein
MITARGLMIPSAEFASAAVTSARLQQLTNRADSSNHHRISVLEQTQNNCIGGPKSII